MADPVITPYDRFYTLTLRSVSIDKCCSFLTYKSLYEKRGKVDPYVGYLTDVRIYKEDCCSERVCLYEALNVPVGQDINFDGLTGDGTYIVVITAYNVDLELDFSTELTVCAKCCEEKRHTLVHTLKEKMACLSCKISDFKVIGKKTRSLEEKYLKLSNMLYVLDYSGCWGKIPLSCEEVEILKCSIPKII